MLNGAQDEKRESERREINEMAWIVDPDVGHPNECSLRNISTRGALIEMAQVMDLPNYLLIILPGEDYAMECRVTWREERNLGVEFL